MSLAITHIEDVTEQRRAAEQLQYAATHDELTGLPNRVDLIHIARRDRLATADRVEVAVLFIDLDNFKVDQRQPRPRRRRPAAARRCRERLRVGRCATTTCSARFGGDEFIVVLRDGDARRWPSPSGCGAAVRHAGRRSTGTSCSSPPRIGYSTNHRTGHDRPTTCCATPTPRCTGPRRAVATASRRSRPARTRPAVLALRTAGELRRGIERGEIVPYFQPIVDLDDRAASLGFEVLARWLHPDRGLLGPGRVPADGRGDRPDRSSSGARDPARLAGAARPVAHGQPAVRRPARCRSTSAPGSSSTPTSTTLVVEALAETGIDADSLWLEITETALLADVKAATVALRELRSLGLHLSVDDFGTGYSSLTYLKRFPVEAIKIDRSFVAGPRHRRRGHHDRRGGRPTSASRSASTSSPRASRRRCSCRVSASSAATAARATCSVAPARPP